MYDILALDIRIFLFIEMIIVLRKNFTSRFLVRYVRNSTEIGWPNIKCVYCLELGAAMQWYNYKLNL